MQEHTQGRRGGGPASPHTAAEWANWSGSVRFTPARVERPRDEDAVRDVVRRAAREGRTVRPVGASHSSSDVFRTRDVLLSLEHLTGRVDHDTDARVATMRAGTRLEDAGAALRDVGLAFHNYGDVDVQSLAGVIATGTHGTGRALPNLATMLVGGRLVTGTGDVVTFDAREDPALVRALRVNLGALGVLTEMRLALLPEYALRRQEWCASADDLVEHVDALVDRNRHFDFYWYPRSDEVKLRTLNPPGEGLDAADVPWARLVEDRTDTADRIIPKTRALKFEEMEYALPIEQGLACFQAVRERVKARHRARVGWRVLWRTVAADDAFLSTAYARDTVTISLHHNAGLPFREYFDDLEPVFRSHDGRPHWGKKHSLRAADLRALYPEWDRFLDARARFDPDGVFLGPELKALLGADAP